MTRLFDRLYEDSLSGRISNENFTRLIDKYQTEQEKLLEQMATLEDALVIEMNFLFRYTICKFTKDSRKREEI